MYSGSRVQVIESICLSRHLDDYFQQKRSTDAAYWDAFGVQAPSMYFGSQEGMFRIFPGRHRSTCGDFDPRLRPWYIAASSGPKNVVLVLDTSGSMQGQRLELLKQAVTRVIDTLTVSDRVAIVPFSSTASVLGDEMGRLLTASATNKDILIAAIDGLVAEGSTNFYDALQHAFNALNLTIQAELHVPCNSAILFFTDGVMTDPKGITEQNVTDLVSSRLEATMKATGKPILFFTYSISDESTDDVHAFPKELACSTQFGVWSKIATVDDIIGSLSSYYRLFTLGLGDGRNKDFVAWVEPYKFATGNVLGTTVSAPVYDRSVVPPLFVGAVGIDVTLGVKSGIQDSIDRIVRASTARCPTLNLTLCELESYRRQSATGNNSMCFVGNCSASDFVQVEATKCASVSDYASDVWANTNYEGKSYAVSVLCDVPWTDCQQQAVNILLTLY
jgi:von Willebrand factor type A domain